LKKAIYLSNARISYAAIQMCISFITIIKEFGLNPNGKKDSVTMVEKTPLPIGSCLRFMKF
jgi:hypothetical protein